MQACAKSWAGLALLCCAFTLPARAESSASSAVSDSVSTSVGSLSGSVQKSSNSSSKDDKVAEGEYRIVEIAAAPGQPDTARLRLQALANPGADGEFFLYMPQDAATQSRLAEGHVVTVRARPYGLEFAKVQTHRAFFLVLADDWYRELQTKVVKL